MTLKDAEALAIKVLSKTLDMTKLTAEKSLYTILYEYCIIILFLFMYFFIFNSTYRNIIKMLDV